MVSLFVAGVAPGITRVTLHWTMGDRSEVISSYIQGTVARYLDISAASSYPTAC